MGDGFKSSEGKETGKRIFVVSNLCVCVCVCVCVCSADVDGSKIKKGKSISTLYELEIIPFFFYEYGLHF